MRRFCFSVGKKELEVNKILKYANKAMIIDIGINLDTDK